MGNYFKTGASVTALALRKQEVADVDAKYKMRASELADDVAALGVEEQALRRRPKKTSAYEALKKVSKPISTCQDCPSPAVAMLKTV